MAGEEGTYRRVEEVLDCWFESGSMPYAQLHYPFENQAVFNAGFPAEFIAEGLDQTRGWFYTLTVLSAALFKKPAFRNVIVNGMVMAEDGRKMSKRLRNYTPPDELMEVYGADALRLYLINSGLVRGEEQRFADNGVKDMTRRTLLPWYHAFQFLMTYATIDHWSPDKGLHYGSNILDQWILSRLQTLEKDIGQEMRKYRLYNVVPRLLEFIEDLTNGYIRLNRDRFWGKDITADKIAAYSTLYTVIEELTMAMAPFTPFLAEHLYQELAKLKGRAAPKPLSVHLCSYPDPEEALMQPRLEEAVSRMQQVILLGRQRREEVKINLRKPMRRLTIVHRDAGVAERTADARSVHPARVERQRGRLRPGGGQLHPVVRKTELPRTRQAARQTHEGIRRTHPAADARPDRRVAGNRLDHDRRRNIRHRRDPILREAKPGTNALSNRYISIDLDSTLDDELIAEGIAREAVNRIQRSRKEMNLNVSDRIAVIYSGAEPVTAAIVRYCGLRRRRDARDAIGSRRSRCGRVRYGDRRPPSSVSNRSRRGDDREGSEKRKRPLMRPKLRRLVSAESLYLSLLLAGGDIDQNRSGVSTLVYAYA